LEVFRASDITLEEANPGVEGRRLNAIHDGNFHTVIEQPTGNRSSDSLCATCDQS
jgi:hypothetical protein